MLRCEECYVGWCLTVQGFEHCHAHSRTLHALQGMFAYMHADFSDASAAVAAAAACGVHRSSVLQECHESMCCNPWDVVHPQGLTVPCLMTALSQRGECIAAQFCAATHCGWQLLPWL